MEKLEFLTARYVTSFSCLGADCPATCCRGWQIDLDRPHYVKLRTKMERSQAEREEFERGVAVNDEAAQSELTFARIKLNEEGRCPFLTKQDMCSVHQRYGIEALNNTCTQYPRKLVEVAGRREMWGDLSCPEMARLCLLDPDAMEIVDAKSDPTHRMLLERLLADSRTPYQLYFDDLRATALRLLSLRTFPLASRLFMLAYLGKRTAAFYNKSATSVDEQRLAAEVGAMGQAELLRTLHERFRGFKIPSTLAVGLVTELVKTASGGSLGALIRTVFESYEAEAGASDGVPYDQVWALYEQRKQPWIDAFSSRIDLCFENYSKNAWLKDWFVSSSDLLAHAQRHILHVAVMRFLALSHPRLRAVPVDAAPADRQRALDEVIVEVVYRFSRGIEHAPDVVAGIEAGIKDKHANNFAQSATLALV